VPLGLRTRHKDCADGLVEHLLEAALCECAAFDIGGGADLLFHREALLVLNGSLSLLAESLDGLAVVAQVELRADQHYWRVRAVVPHLREPLSSNVFK
jgi:hypothetical protein